MNTETGPDTRSVSTDRERMAIALFSLKRKENSIIERNHFMNAIKSLGINKQYGSAFWYSVWRYGGTGKGKLTLPGIHSWRELDKLHKQAKAKANKATRKKQKQETKQFNPSASFKKGILEALFDNSVDASKKLDIIIDQLTDLQMPGDSIIAQNKVLIRENVELKKKIMELEDAGTS